MGDNWLRDVHTMYEKFGFFGKDPYHLSGALVPGVEGVKFDGEFLLFRKRFLDEELSELDEGIRENDPVKVVDSLVDLCVVAIGTLDLGMGYESSSEAWNIVNMANMSKERKDNPARTGAGGFDLIKPLGWKPPNYETLELGSFPEAVHAARAKILSMMGTLPSVAVLQACIKLQNRKAEDYQSEESGITRADYYPRGVDSIHDIVHMKMLRVRSIIAKMRVGKSATFESLVDSILDAINYLSFMAAYVNGELDGQDPLRDIFNRPLLSPNPSPCDHFIGHLMDDGRAVAQSAYRPGMSVIFFKHCPHCGYRLGYIREEAA